MYDLDFKVLLGLKWSAAVQGLMILGRTAGLQMVCSQMQQKWKHAQK